MQALDLFSLRTGHEIFHEDVSFKIFVTLALHLRVFKHGNFLIGLWITCFFILYLYEYYMDSSVVKPASFAFHN